MTDSLATRTVYQAGYRDREGAILWEPTLYQTEEAAQDGMLVWLAQRQFRDQVLIVTKPIEIYR